jgi:hypothetical protein
MKNGAPTVRMGYVIVAFVVLVAGGMAFVFGRPHTSPEPAVATPATAAQQSAAAPRASAGLACIQDALGGVYAFARVASLRILGTTTPVASTGLRPVSNKREIRIVFPDRYQRLDVQTGMPEGRAPLTSLIGFNGDVLLSQPRDPDASAAMKSARLDFVREVLMRLPRELPGVRLSQRTTGYRADGGREWLTIDAYAQESVAATLLADPASCLPVAVQYRSSTGLLASRVELSDYRAFDGIRFPTVLRTAKNGQPWIEEHDSDVQVNAPQGDKYFASGER